MEFDDVITPVVAAHQVRLRAAAHPPDMLYRQHHGDECYRAPLRAARANSEVGTVDSIVIDGQSIRRLPMGYGRSRTPRSLRRQRWPMRQVPHAPARIRRLVDGTQTGQTDFALSGPRDWRRSSAFLLARRALADDFFFELLGRGAFFLGRAFGAACARFRLGFRFGCAGLRGLGFGAEGAGAAGTPGRSTMVTSSSVSSMRPSSFRRLRLLRTGSTRSRRHYLVARPSFLRRSAALRSG